MEATVNNTGAGSRKWWVLAVMSVGTLIVFLDNTVVNTALPAISVDLEASTSTLQWVIDSYVCSFWPGCCYSVAQSVIALEGSAG